MPQHKLIIVGNKAISVDNCGNVCVRNEDPTDVSQHFIYCSDYPTTNVYETYNKLYTLRVNDSKDAGSDVIALGPPELHLPPPWVLPAGSLKLNWSLEEGYFKNEFDSKFLAVENNKLVTRVKERAQSIQIRNAPATTQVAVLNKLHVYVEIHYKSPHNKFLLTTLSPYASTLLPCVLVNRASKVKHVFRHKETQKKLFSRRIENNYDLIIIGGSSNL